MTERWAVETPRPTDRPVVAAGRVFLPGADALHALDAETGEVAWSYDLFGEVVALTLGVPTLVVGTAAGEVYAVYDSDGPRELWRRTVGGKVVALAQVGGGDVPVSAFGGKLRRVADGAHTGSDRWANRDGGTAQGGIAVTAGTVFGGNLAGLTACGTHEGNTRWTAPGKFPAGPAAAGDTVYAA